MAEVRYQPMHAPRKTVTEAQMRETLRKRCEEAKRRIEDGGKEAERPRTAGLLVWRTRIPGWEVESACGRYRILKRCVEHATNRHEAIFVYECERKTTWCWFVFFSTRDEEEAFAACESDAGERP